MKSFLKRLFCSHSNLKQIAKYYVTSEGGWFLGSPETFIDIYSLGECPDCKKRINVKILTKQFDGWNDNRTYQAKLIESGYCNFEDFVLEPEKYLNK